MGSLSSFQDSSQRNDRPQHSPPLLIKNLNIKFLKKKDPTNQTWYSFLLTQEILDGCVIGVNNDLRVHDVRSEFFEGEYHR
jgi:hypothetical protein